MWGTRPKNIAEFITGVAFDLPDYIGQRAARLLVGKGYMLNSLNNTALERIQDILKFNNFLNFLWQNEYQMSNIGYAVLTIRPDIKGNIRIFTSMIDMTVTNFLGLDYQDNETALVTWRTVTWDTKNFRIREVWGLNSVQTWVYFISGEGKKDKNNPNETITVAEYNVLVPEHLQLPDMWDYSQLQQDYGFIPAKVFRNLPSVGNWNVGIATTSGTSGTTPNGMLPVSMGFIPDGYKFRNLQTKMNIIQSTWVKDVIMSQTRIAGNFTSGEIASLQNGTTSFQDFVGDVIINASANKNSKGTAKNDFNAGTELQLLTADTKGKDYAEQVLKVIDEYSLGCQYSGLNDSTAARTSGGVAVTQSNDISTTKLKKTLREDQLNIFIKKLIAIDKLYGLGQITYEQKEKVKDDKDKRKNAFKQIKEDVTITFKTNVAFDETTRIAWVKEGLALGVITKETAIAVYNDIDNENDIKIIEQRAEVVKNAMDKMGSFDNPLNGDKKPSTDNTGNK